mgnify:CR=1 FL=1
MFLPFLLFPKKNEYIWFIMKVLLHTYTIILNTVYMIMCNTRMHKQYLYIKKSTPENKFKQRF